MVTFFFTTSQCFFNISNALFHLFFFVYSKIFYDKRISQDVAVDALGEEFKGYVFRITGGNDKEGFPMKQGVLVAKRVRLLLSKGHSCYRPRRTGERKRKSVRGCIVGPDISALSLVLVKRGEQDIPGLTDRTLARRLAPKRASKIRKLYGIAKYEDVRKFVLRRTIEPKLTGDPEKDKIISEKRPVTKAPKIQRLVTPVRIQRKRKLKKVMIEKIVKNRKAAAEYAALLKSHLEARMGKKMQLASK